MIKKKEEKIRTPKKKGPKLKLEEQKSIFEDNKLIADVGAKVVFLRLGEIHEGYIKSIDENHVSIWDETRDQYFLVDLLSNSQKKVYFDPRT